MVQDRVICQPHYGSEDPDLHIKQRMNERMPRSPVLQHNEARAQQSKNKTQHHTHHTNMYQLLPQATR